MMKGSIENAFMLLKAGKVREAIPYITQENVYQIFMADYAENTRASDVPEFVEHLCANGYVIDGTNDVDYCMYWFYHTGKPKSARKLLDFYPHRRLDHELFENMCNDECTEGVIHMIDMGIRLEWIEKGLNIPYKGLDFHFARTRARKRAMILLWVPARCAGGDRGAKRDVFRIIARVIWSMRRFN